MKTVEVLASAAQNKRVGNHRVVIHSNGSREFYYYDTVICRADYYFKKFAVDNSYGTVSTTRAVNAYRKYFTAMGYKEDEENYSNSLLSE